MPYDIGPQYPKDDPFKARARLHQSHYRAKILKVNYDKYGSRLTEEDGRNLLNYYDGLNVRKILKKRYPKYSKNRDANLLRSEHIPFNLLAPLDADHKLAIFVLDKAFQFQAEKIIRIEFEFAPKPKGQYLDDATSFDVYFEFINRNNKKSGLGIEVKYSEQEYPLQGREKENVEDMDSRYWKLTLTSDTFINPSDCILGSDGLRQVWRNHLLGLAMVEKGAIQEFTSITLFPEGNEHFHEVLPIYQSLLKPENTHQVRGCTYEEFINAIDGGKEILNWKQYLLDRYIVHQVE